MSLAWNNYSESYNLLSDKMRESGIDVSFLNNVISAYENVLRNNKTNDSKTNYLTNNSNNNPQNNLSIKIKVVKYETLTT